MAAAGNGEQGSTGHVGDGDGLFAQRRVRHIASILLRNVAVSSGSAETAASVTTTLHRPRPRRSISTASASSSGTIKRAPSISSKSPASKSRARASSIASTRSTAIEPEVFLSSDLVAIRRAIESRLCRAFVTLTRIEDNKEVYRTSTSAGAGINFEWGRCAGSSDEFAGLPLGLLADGMSTEESVRVAVWFRQENAADKGKAREAPVMVKQGREAQLGWSLLWQHDVHLKSLTRVPSTSLQSYPPNTLLFGFSPPLAQVQRIEKDEEGDVKESSGQARNKTNGSGTKGDQVHYYMISPAHYEASKMNGAEEASTEVVRGYEVEDVLRILQLQRELYQAICDESTSEERSCTVLEGEQGPVAKELRCAEEQERLGVLRSQRGELLEAVKAKRRLVQERTEGISRRKARLEIARRAMAKERTSYKDLNSKMSQLSRQCVSIRAKAFARRVLLLQQLDFIYPVELVDGATLLFSIVGIPLANRVVDDEKGRPKGQREDEDTVSSALGMIGQVVGLLSVYLDTPLHYPIATAGSRSVIQDSISVMSGPRAFPLYAKGVEAYRFEYAMFLLNKNIEQLMNHLGITIVDIRNTLPNLKNLLLISSGG